MNSLDPQFDTVASREPHPPHRPCPPVSQHCKSSLRCVVSRGVLSALEALFPVKTGRGHPTHRHLRDHARKPHSKPLTRSALSELPRGHPQCIVSWIDGMEWEQEFSPLLVKRIQEGCGQFDRMLTAAVVESRRVERERQEQELEELRASKRDRDLLPRRTTILQFDHLNVPAALLLEEVSRLSQEHWSPNSKECSPRLSLSQSSGSVASFLRGTSSVHSFFLHGSPTAAGTTTSATAFLPRDHTLFLLEGEEEGEGEGEAEVVVHAWGQRLLHKEFRCAGGGEVALRPQRGSGTQLDSLDLNAS